MKTGETDFRFVKHPAILRKASILRAMFISIALIPIFFGGTHAEQPKRVLILPFTIHAKEDLSFLEKGISTILQSRIAIAGKTIVIPNDKGVVAETGQISEEKALSMGEKVSADFVLMGSLTIFGDSVSTEATFIDTLVKKSVITYHNFSQHQGDALTHINILADRIVSEVFHETPQPAPVAEKTAQPLAEGKGASKPLPGVGQPASDIWKSDRLKIQIKGLAIGDVDGDGKNETVFVTDKNIFVYRYLNGEFQKIKQMDEKGISKILGVDLIDLNQNGKAEVFISRLSRSQVGARSSVIEWKESGFIPIIAESPWCYRVVRPPQKGTVLLGQKMEDGSQPFTPGVYEITFENGRYESYRRQVLPEWINLYCFNSGDVLNDGKEMVIALTQFDRLEVLSRNGETIWASADYYGGSTNFVEVKSKDDPGKIEQVYLSQRIHVADLNHEGKNQVVIVKNQDRAGRTFSSFRSYKSAYIICLEWKEIGFEEKWKTQEMSGYISDYVLGDLDNDGRDELVFSLITTGGGLIGKKESFIVAQELKK